MTTATRTTCPYCGVGCGVLAARDERGAVTVRGDPEHPANRGRLCSKGTALAETLGLEGRLLEPMIGEQAVGWDAALDHVAMRLRQCIDRHGPESVALYVSGQLLTEDYYVANKLVKGFIGSANIDTNSRLCMSSAVAGHVRAFGEDIVPVDYDDLESADLIVLVGSNLAWCHPVLMQRILAAKERRPQLRLVVVDPRRTASCESADLHLPLRSGTDVMLFNGLLAWLADHGHVDAAFVAEHTTGFVAALQAARTASQDVAATAQACGLDPAGVQQFFEWFVATGRVVTAFSQGVNQSSAGTDKVNSIINCHLATGRIGRAGTGPFSITGQPNAMGGREVGGLSTQLAAHLSLEDPAHRQAVQTFWSSPSIADRPGYKAVDLFQAIDAGKVRAVWIIATNPVVSLPDADTVRRALSRCEFVVVSDCVARNDTLAFAHVKLPAAGWGEKDGTVTNSERQISRQRAFLPLPGQARPDWWILAQVARRLGHQRAFGYQRVEQIFDEHARLTTVACGFGRLLDLAGLADRPDAEYQSMSPRQWPVPAAGAAVSRPFAQGKFPTADGRARFVATSPRLPHHPAVPEYPLVLNTGRTRDQWHTMTRTGRAAALNAHEPEPYVDAHRADLQSAGLVVGQIVRVVSRWGAALGRLRSSGDVPQGMLFMPIHWSERFARLSSVGPVVNPVVDLVSGEPEFKHTPVRLESWAAHWTGFLLSCVELDSPGTDWWAASRVPQGFRYEMAGSAGARPDVRWLRTMLGADRADDEWLELEDPGSGSRRVAVLREGRLLACLMIESGNMLPSRAWLTTLLGREALEPTERRNLLRGRPPDGAADPGPVVCACLGVGANTIQGAIDAGCASVEALGRKLRAGTNCGSCRPELARMLAVARRFRRATGST